MKFLLLWRRLSPLVYQQTDLLRDDVADFLDRRGLPASEETSRECLLFILWSVHVGLMNMRPGIRRSLLLWLHKRKVAKVAQAGDPRLVTLYERRLVEALYVITNIFAERTAQGWSLPLSPRFARMFLNNATTGSGDVSKAAADDVLPILRSRSAACIGTFLAT